MINYTEVLLSLIGLIATLLGAYLTSLIKRKDRYIQFNMLSDYAETFVLAVEQLYGPETGEEKLEYVQERLRDLGFEAGTKYIQAVIESEVKKLCKREPTQTLK